MIGNLILVEECWFFVSVDGFVSCLAHSRTTVAAGVAIAADGTPSVRCHEHPCSGIWHMQQLYAAPFLKCSQLKNGFELLLH